MVQKIFGSTKMLVSNLFWVQTNFRLMKILGLKNSLLRWFQKKFCPKKVCVQKIVDPKKYCVQTKFWSKKIFCWKKFCVQKFVVKNFSFKKCCVQNILGPKNFWVHIISLTWPVLTGLDQSWLNLTFPNFTWPVSNDLFRMDLY